VKPAGGPTGEDCRRGETAADGGKHNVGVIGNRAQCVKATTEPAPARTKEVILAQPVAPRLLEIEWTCGELCWNQWFARHGPKIVGEAASKWNSAR
jgi:hypothetical protein